MGNATLSHLGLSRFSTILATKKSLGCDFISGLDYLQFGGERSQPSLYLRSRLGGTSEVICATSAPVVNRWETDGQMGQVLAWDETVPHNLLWIVRPPPRIGVLVTQGKVSRMDGMDTRIEHQPLDQTSVTMPQVSLCLYCHFTKKVV